jgi:hypothetical protein
MHLGKTHRFKKIASDAWHVGAGSAIIDGVLWVIRYTPFGALSDRRPTLDAAN